MAQRVWLAISWCSVLCFIWPASATSIGGHLSSVSEQRGFPCLLFLYSEAGKDRTLALFDLLTKDGARKKRKKIESWKRGQVFCLISALHFIWLERSRKRQHLLKCLQLKHISVGRSFPQCLWQSRVFWEIAEWGDESVSEPHRRRTSSSDSHFHIVLRCLFSSGPSKSEVCHFCDLHPDFLAEFPFKCVERL